MLQIAKIMKKTDRKSGKAGFFLKRRLCVSARLRLSHRRFAHLCRRMGLLLDGFVQQLRQCGLLLFLSYPGEYAHVLPLLWVLRATGAFRQVKGIIPFYIRVRVCIAPCFPAAGSLTNQKRVRSEGRICIFFVQACHRQDVRLPVGIGDPVSLPLAVLQTKKESELRGEFVFALFKPAIGRHPVGIRDPFSLPLAVLQRKKCQTENKFSIWHLFAL